MAVNTTLAGLSQTAASNGPDGSADPPSALDDAIRYALSFIAQLRDGNGFATGTGNVGQCRLTKSGSNLLLSRYNGVGLTINGVTYAIPSAGVTLAPTSLTPSTLYYIYAYMNAGVMTLEASTTGHSTDTASGMEIKTGDATRTLVGMARPVTGPAWQDAANQRFVVSWFNQRPIFVSAAFTTGRGYSSSTTGEVNSEIRNEFLTWANTNVHASIDGGATLSVAGVIADTWVGLDSAIGESFDSVQAPANSSRVGVHTSLDVAPSEGYHYTTLLSDNPGTAGTITYLGAATPIGRTALKTIIQG